MNTIRQLIRQPMKSAAFVLLIALAVSTLSISLGQAIVAGNMEAELENRFITTALATDKYQHYEELVYSENHQMEQIKQTFHMTKPESVTEMMRSLAEQYPELVQSIHRPGLATAYIPSLKAANYTDLVSTRLSSATGNLNTVVDTAPFGAPYTQILAQITLTEIQEHQYYYFEDSVKGTAAVDALRQLSSDAILESLEHPETLTQEELDALLPVQVTLVGSIDQVLGLQEGFADPTGFTARMTLILPNLQALDALELEVGGTYLVYGMDYYDNDWYLRNQIFSEAHGIVSAELGDAVTATAIDAFDPENLVMLTQKQIDGYTWSYRHNHNGEYPPSYQVAYYIHKEIREDGSSSVARCINLTNQDMLNFRSSSFTLFDLRSLLPDLDACYGIPTITRLDGSAEAFLASEEGVRWSQILDEIQISNHSFATIGVEDLNAIGCFANQSAWISSGRNFRDEEVENGEKVCIISQHLAEINGLSVGDTIALNYHNYDWESPYQNFLSDGYGITNPGGYFYSALAGLAGEAEAYTIVGLYEKDHLWSNASGTLYGITPNTVFVPKTAVIGDLDYADQGLFYTAVLNNGAKEDFEQLLVNLGEDGLFLVDDQGYGEVVDSIHDYQALAYQALSVGLVVYGIIMVLFLLLFPGMQRKTLAVMSSLGASTREKRGHMCKLYLGILVPGSLVGLMLGCLLWNQVAGYLMHSARVVLELNLNLPVLAGVCFGQFLLIFTLSVLVSLPMTAQQNLLYRTNGFRRLMQKLRGLTVKRWGIVLFAVIISASLCLLHASNEAEQLDYQTAYQNTPVKVTLQTISTQSAYDLDADGSVTDLFTIERFARFTPLKYLKDLQFMCQLKPVSLNGAENRISFAGITAGACPPELSNQKECEIHWEEGYDFWVFDEPETMYVLLPDAHRFTDLDPNNSGMQIQVLFSNEVFTGYADSSYGEDQGKPLYEVRNYEVMATVAGTYSNSVSSQTVFCGFSPLQYAASQIYISLNLDHISGTLKNNEEASALREMANQWFADPNDSVSSKDKKYAMVIDTGVLENLKVTLENSMSVNRICTVLVFLLSAGAGFFLGFLMIRSRKREIILMRTLGKPNFWIFMDYIREQMASVLMGTALGGLLFLWNPIGNLVLFLLIYFAGLSAALAIFINSKLLTTLKEVD